MAPFNQRIQSFYWLIFSISLMIFSYPILASVHPKQEEANATISQLYHTLKNTQKLDMASRLDLISAQFLGKVYLLGALGEGAKARFDQTPRYRVDAFDCETYVTTVLALALANNTKGFKQCLSNLRYEDGKVAYIKRNHFTSLDWNQNNQKKGFVKDITLSFKDENNKPVALIATALIDKPSWYQHLGSTTIRLHPQNKKEQRLRLADLKKRGSQLPKVESRIPYLPLSVLFDEKGQPNHYLFSQIPNASIIEIIRPNWDLVEEIGTHLNVSHLGFAFWKNKTLFFREASSIYGKVVDVPLIDYLAQARSSPTIKGINVQVVVPLDALASGCEN